MISAEVQHASMILQVLQQSKPSMVWPPHAMQLSCSSAAGVVSAAASMLISVATA